MSFGLDSVFGIHANAMELRAKRTEILANNIANADTPGYKARDIDFDSILKNLDTSQSASQLATTNPLHLQNDNSLQNPGLVYRVPLQQSLDGNTVDSQIETAAFAENSIRYQASLQFLTADIKQLMAAIKGD